VRAIAVFPISGGAGEDREAMAFEHVEGARVRSRRDEDVGELGRGAEIERRAGAHLGADELFEVS